MKSPELQLLTASEPLSLEEEYAMQNTWQMDENSVSIQFSFVYIESIIKYIFPVTELTFIVLDKEKYEETSNEIGTVHASYYFLTLNYIFFQIL